MIFNNLTFAGTKQSGVQFVLGAQFVNGIQFRRSFVNIRDYSETTQKKLRSASNEVSSNNMLTTILRPFIHNTGRECWRIAFIGPWNHKDYKRPKLAETDSSTFSEDIPIREGKNLLLKCAFLMLWWRGSLATMVKLMAQLFSAKCWNFSSYKCRKLHQKDDTTVLSEDLKMDVTWVLLRMQLAYLMQSDISSDNMQQVPSLGGCQCILNPWVLRLCKIGHCPMIEGFCSDFTTVYTVLKHAKTISDVLKQHDAATTSYVAIFIQVKEIQMKFPQEFSNTVVRSGGLHSALNCLSSLGKKFRFYVLALGNISVSVLIIFIKFFLMIFNKLTFPHTKQSGVQFSWESSASTQSQSGSHSSPSKTRVRRCGKNWEVLQLK